MHMAGRAFLCTPRNPEQPELPMNSCSLPNYDRMSEPDKIFLGWRETRAEGTARVYRRGGAAKDGPLSHAGQGNVSAG